MKIKEKLLTLGTSLGLGIMTLSNTVFADIVSEVSGGGEIQNSKIGTGFNWNFTMDNSICWSRFYFMARF